MPKKKSQNKHIVDLKTSLDSTPFDLVKYQTALEALAAHHDVYTILANEGLHLAAIANHDVLKATLPHVKPEAKMELLAHHYSLRSRAFSGSMQCAPFAPDWVALLPMLITDDAFGLPGFVDLCGLVLSKHDAGGMLACMQFMPALVPTPLKWADSSGEQKMAIRTLLQCLSQIYTEAHMLGSEDVKAASHVEMQRLLAICFDRPSQFQFLLNEIDHCPSLPDDKFNNGVLMLRAYLDLTESLSLVASERSALGDKLAEFQIEAMQAIYDEVYGRAQVEQIIEMRMKEIRVLLYRRDLGAFSAQLASLDDIKFCRMLLADEFWQLLLDLESAPLNAYLQVLYATAMSLGSEAVTFFMLQIWQLTGSAKVLSFGVEGAKAIAKDESPGVSSVLATFIYEHMHEAAGHIQFEHSLNGKTFVSLALVISDINLFALLIEAYRHAGKLDILYQQVYTLIEKHDLVINAALKALFDRELLNLTTLKAQISATGSDPRFIAFLEEHEAASDRFPMIPRGAVDWLALLKSGNMAAMIVKRASIGIALSEFRPKAVLINSDDYQRKQKDIKARARVLVELQALVEFLLEDLERLLNPTAATSDGVNFNELSSLIKVPVKRALLKGNLLTAFATVENSSVAKQFWRLYVLCHVLKSKQEEIKFFHEILAAMQLEPGRFKLFPLLLKEAQADDYFSDSIKAVLKAIMEPIIAAGHHLTEEELIAAFSTAPVVAKKPKKQTKPKASATSLVSTAADMPVAAAIEVKPTSSLNIKEIFAVPIANTELQIEKWQEGMARYESRPALSSANIAACRKIVADSVKVWRAFVDSPLSSISLPRIHPLTALRIKEELQRQGKGYSAEMWTAYADMRMAVVSLQEAAEIGGGLVVGESAQPAKENLIKLSSYWQSLLVDVFPELPAPVSQPAKAKAKMAKPLATASAAPKAEKPPVDSKPLVLSAVLEKAAEHKPELPVAIVTATPSEHNVAQVVTVAASTVVAEPAVAPVDSAASLATGSSTPFRAMGLSDTDRWLEAYRPLVESFQSQSQVILLQLADCYQHIIAIQRMYAAQAFPQIAIRLNLLKSTHGVILGCQQKLANPLASHDYSQELIPADFDERPVTGPLIYPIWLTQITELLNKWNYLLNQFSFQVTDLCTALEHTPAGIPALLRHLDGCYLWHEDNYVLHQLISLYLPDFKVEKAGTGVFHPYFNRDYDLTLDWLVPADGSMIEAYVAVEAEMRKRFPMATVEQKQGIGGVLVTIAAFDPSFRNDKPIELFVTLKRPSMTDELEVKLLHARMRVVSHAEPRLNLRTGRMSVPRNMMQYIVHNVLELDRESAEHLEMQDMPHAIRCWVKFLPLIQSGVLRLGPKYTCFIESMELAGAESKAPNQRQKDIMRQMQIAWYLYGKHRPDLFKQAYHSLGFEVTADNKVKPIVMATSPKSAHSEDPKPPGTP